MDALVGCLSWLCVLSPLIAVGALVAWRFRPRRPVSPEAARAALERMAERFGAGTLDADGRLEVRRGGYAGRLEFVRGARPSTDLTFNLDGAVDGHVQVALEGVGRSMLKQLGVPEFQVGDREFDDFFDIRASEPRHAFAILGDDARRILIELGKRFDIVYRVTPHAFLLRAKGHLADPERLERVVSGGMQLLELLKLPERDTVVITAAEQAPVAQANCEICGTGLGRGAVVRCRKCRTPHHQDCWEFNGRCATYACGESGYQLG